HVDLRLVGGVRHGDRAVGELRRALRVPVLPVAAEDEGHSARGELLERHVAGPGRRVARDVALLGPVGDLRERLLQRGGVRLGVVESVRGDEGEGGAVLVALPREGEADVLVADLRQGVAQGVHGRGRSDPELVEDVLVVPEGERVGEALDPVHLAVDP
ncbi:hypothetical protein ABE10_02830, partial [Bacillus toyonensis]|nr:hypothetical protein [Bacillus toyonensis]